MTHEAKHEIIEILQQWKSMLGVNKARTEELISEMNMLYVGVPIDETQVEEVKGYFEHLAMKLGYDVTIDNNKLRNSERSTERITMYYLAVEKFGRSKTLDTAAHEFFGKDRTTMVYWRRKSIEMLETKDPIFMKFIERLTLEVGNNESIAA